MEGERFSNPVRITRMAFTTKVNKLKTAHLLLRYRCFITEIIVKRVAGGIHVDALTMSGDHLIVTFLEEQMARNYTRRELFIRAVRYESDLAPYVINFSMFNNAGNFKGVK